MSHGEMFVSGVYLFIFRPKLLMITLSDFNISVILHLWQN